MNNLINQSVHRFAYDVNGLNQLKRNVAKGTNQSIKQVAEQFETLFINMMMQSMRKAVPDSGLFNQPATQLFTSMFDQQIAQQAAGKGLGLANIITKQLTHGKPLSPNVSSSGNIPIPPQKSSQQPNLKLAQSLFSNASATVTPEALGQMLYHSHKIDNASKINASEITSLNPADKANQDHVTAFIKEWLIPAQQASKSSGIPYEVIIAQAALETGWGQKLIKTADNQSSHNYFGIKATPTWQGNATRLTTQEFINDRMIKIQDNFKVYTSKQHALTDYINLLTKSPRYQAVVKAPDARTAAKALQSAKYATDPNYSDKLIQIIARIEQIAQQNPITTVSGFRKIAFN